jgi:hypothetical protein
METPALARLGKTVRRSTALTDGIGEYTGEWTTTEVVHLLKRTLFGVKVNEIGRAHV